MKRALSIVVAICLLSGTSWADNLNPPDWADQGNSAFQAWEFDTAINPAPPDADENPYGDPLATIAGGWPTTDWLSADGAEDGVWVTEDYILLDLPNFPEPNPQKLIRLQLTWWADNTPRLSYQLPDPAGVVSETHVETVSLPTGYNHSTYDIVVEPNPPWEKIAILPRNCTLYVSEIVVHTLCAPEPSTVTLFCVGGTLALAVWVSKRRRSR